MKPMLLHSYSWFQYISFSFIRPIMDATNEKASHQQRLHANELPQLPLYLTTEYNATPYKHSYAKNPTVFKSIMHTHGKQIGFSIFLNLLLIPTQYLAVYMLKYLFKNLYSSTECSLAWVMAICIGHFLVNMLVTLCLHHCYHIMNMVSIKIYECLSSAVITHTLKLSVSDKQTYSAGAIINLVSIYCSKISTFVIQVPLLIAIPLQTIIGIGLMTSEIGFHSLSSIVILIISCILQNAISIASIRYTSEQAKYTEYKSKAINECLVGIRTIKTNALEEFQLNTFKNICNEEEKIKQKLSIISTYSECLMIITPMLVLFSVLFTFTLHNGFGQLDYNQISTLINLITVIAVPLKSFADVVRELPNISISATKIQEYLNKTPSKKCNSIENGNTEQRYLKIEKLKLYCIVGEVGSGKTTLLQSIISEPSNEILQIQTEKDRRVYVPQIPWIINATITENIVFYSKLDQNRLNHVINLCELEEDIHTFPNGLETAIGMHGINLSEGQKQRISLARALYSDAEIFLLDDCLCSLDMHISMQIYQRVISGELKSKTVVFVTNQMHLIVNADKIVVMKKGKIVEQGTYSKLTESNGEFTKLLNIKNAKSIKESENTTSKAMPPIQRYQNADIAKKQKQINDSFGISQLFKIGGCALGIASIAIFIINEADMLFALWWIGNLKSNESTLFSYFAIYFMLVLTSIALIVLRGAQIGKFIHGLSNKLQSNLFRAVLHSKLYWLDVIPKGKILNRAINDQNAIDNNLARLAGNNIRILCLYVSSIAYLVLVMPWFVVPLAASLIVCAKIYYTSIQSCTQTKLIDSSAKARIITKFSEIIEGLVPIRVSNIGNKFKKAIYSHINDSSVSYLANRLCQRWQNFRMEVMGNVIVFCVCTYCILRQHYYRNSDGRFETLAILKIIECVSYVCYLFAGLTDFKQVMISFTRVNNFTKSCPVINYNRTERNISNWPSKGEICCSNLRLRYQDTLAEVIKGVSFKIEPMQKVAIIGRSGSGKTTISLGLIRLIEAAEVSPYPIRIDGIEINKIHPLSIRTKISTIPQVPMLFSGTLKDNVDPMHEHTDEEVYYALKQVEIVNTIKQLDSTDIRQALNYTVLENGANLSYGERQLICFARALIRKPKILILDEAFSGVDDATYNKLQAIILNECKNSTIISIAHKLIGLIKYDRIIVVDKGCIVESGTPHALISNPSSIFTTLIKENGESYYQHMIDSITQSQC